MECSTWISPTDFAAVWIWLYVDSEANVSAWDSSVRASNRSS